VPAPPKCTHPGCNRNAIAEYLIQVAGVGTWVLRCPVHGGVEQQARKIAGQ
jgi:Rieske Fe-S protein